MIFNVDNGKETWSGREKNIYALEFWVKLAEEHTEDFRRPGT